jgi:polyphosphate kinase
MMQILDTQLNDNVQAVWIDADGQNQPVLKQGKAIRSQEAIYQFLGGTK